MFTVNPYIWYQGVKLKISSIFWIEFWVRSRSSTIKFIKFIKKTRFLIFFDSGSKFRSSTRINLKIRPLVKTEFWVRLKKCFILPTQAKKVKKTRAKNEILNYLVSNVRVYGILKIK